MATSQAHGNHFEDYIKVGFFGASNKCRLPTAKFDIEAQYDKSLSLPTSIKTTGSDQVGLSDATRFFSIDIAYRLLVLKYKQNNDMKSPDQLYEFLIDKEYHALLCGDIPLSLIQEIHSHLKGFEAGTEGASLARAWWRDKRADIYDKYRTNVSLNAKIDSKKQRRLQASISLCSLKRILAPYNTFLNSQNTGILYRGFLIPPIQSPSRSFNE